MPIQLDQVCSSNNTKISDVLTSISDEDEADALLKKHVTLCDDIQAFKRRVEDLEALREECPTQKIDLQPDRLEMAVINDYTAQLSREISVAEADIVQLLSNPGGEWVKVASADNSQGYIPTSCLAIIDPDESKREIIDLEQVQQELNNQYGKLNTAADVRKDTLEKLNQKFELDREADDLRQWIKEQEDALKEAQEAGEDPESLRQKFEQFQKNQKQAEKILIDLKGKAENLGMTESASLQAMDAKWKELENLADDTESQIGGAARLKQFLGEAGQIAAWMKRKNVNDQIPETINETKALIRRHDAFEADMKAIQGRVDTLNEQTPKIVEEHPESKEQVESTNDAINHEWNLLKEKQRVNRDMLTKRLKYLEFLQKVQNHSTWIQNLNGYFDRLDISLELPVIEAQTLQHNEHFKLIQVKHEDLKSIIDGGKQLEDHQEDVQIKSEEVQKQSDNLDQKWNDVKKLLDEASALAQFERDCERVEHWMNIRQLGDRFKYYTNTIYIFYTHSQLFFHPSKGNTKI